MKITNYFISKIYLLNIYCDDNNNINKLQQYNECININKNTFSKESINSYINNPIIKNIFTFFEVQPKIFLSSSEFFFEVKPNSSFQSSLLNFNFVESLGSIITYFTGVQLTIPNSKNTANNKFFIIL